MEQTVEHRRVRVDDRRDGRIVRQTTRTDEQHALAEVSGPLSDRGAERGERDIGLRGGAAALMKMGMSGTRSRPPNRKSTGWANP